MDSVFTWLTSHSAGPFGFACVFLLLCICGLGVPVPEDIILISGGYLVRGVEHRPLPVMLISLFSMMLVGLIGILAGDSIIYVLGRRFGMPLAKRRPLSWVLTPERIERVEKLFKKYGQIILVAARFMPGVRAVAFFSAGATKVPYYRFVAFDGLAALVSAPLWVFLGWQFHDKINQVFEWVDRTKQYVGMITLGALLAFVIYRVIVYRRKAPEVAPTTSESSSAP